MGERGQRGGEPPSAAARPSWSFSAAGSSACQEELQEQLARCKPSWRPWARSTKPYQREREALPALAEERERRHKAEFVALEAQMQAKLEALTRANEALTRHLNRAKDLLGRTAGNGHHAVTSRIDADTEEA